MKERPIGVDLFAGAGGMSLGFERAGFDIVAAVEIDPIHAAVHKFNFPYCATIPQSIVGLSGADIRKAARLQGEKIDVVFGGAPCQGFSLIGQRALDDPRNLLVKEFVRVVAELDADFFVFENVRGLTVGKHRRFLDELIEAFQKNGYDVRLPWEVLNAASYGVPQDRRRLFILGCKAGFAIPSYPKATTKPPGSGGGSLPSAPTCRDALGDLPDIEGIDNLLQSDEAFVAQWPRESDYAKGLRCETEESWAFGYERRWDKSLLTSSMRTIHTAASRERFDNTPPGDVEPTSRFFKLAPNGISNTLRAGTDSARGAFTSPRPIHYAYPRCITVREMARLHGYPDWFRFHATKWHGAREVGNSVPPPLAEAVATEILHAIGNRPTKPQKVLQLGDPSLLKMGMKEASDYFGISDPIKKRSSKGRTTREKAAVPK